MLEINEIFGPTIQGEGKCTGNPSVFVRFGKCNMQCAGFEVAYETPSGIKKYSCDSFYASDSAFRKEWVQYPTAESLINDIAKIIPSYRVDLVITGGEPLLYWKELEFQKFLKYYHTAGVQITIETNASVTIESLESWHKDILFSMSVKLSNSGEKISKRLNIATLHNILEKAPQSYLKFVVDKQFIFQASQEIESILAQIPSCEVYLMPLGDTSAGIDQNSLAVIELALEKGYKYSDRLHIRVWNNKRGV